MAEGGRLKFNRELDSLTSYFLFPISHLFFRLKFSKECWFSVGAIHESPEKEAPPSGGDSGAKVGIGRG